MGSDVGVIFGEFVNNATVGGVEVDGYRFTSLADFFNPAFGFFRDAVGALAFVVGDIDVDTGDFGILRDEGLRDDVLEAAEVFGVFADEQAVHAGRGDVELNDFVVDC